MSIDEFFKRRDCETLIKHEREAIPAKPEGEWYRRAEKEEYTFCIHEKGLK